MGRRRAGESTEELPYPISFVMKEKSKPKRNVPKGIILSDA